MRNLLLLSLGVFLILLQSNLYRLLQFSNINGLTPSLILHSFCSLECTNTQWQECDPHVRLLAIYSSLFAGAPIGLFTFIYVSIWWLARITGVRLTTQTWLSRVSLGFIFTIVEAAWSSFCLAVFGSDTRRPLEISRRCAWHSSINRTGSAVRASACVPIASSEHLCEALLAMEVLDEHPHAAFGRWRISAAHRWMALFVLCAFAIILRTVSCCLQSFFQS